MIKIFLYNSNKINKKYFVEINNKKIYFGDTRYEDYTTHKNDERKYRYLKRHQKNENWNNLMTAGFWSRWLLWNRPNLFESIKDIEKKFNVKIYF